MLFGVPTMYHRLAKAAEGDESVVKALAGARLLVSGSAPLAAQDRDIIQRLTGKSPIERYGLTETLIVCAMPPSPSPIILQTKGNLEWDLRCRASKCGWWMTMEHVIPDGTADALGEVEVRGASLFHGYLDRPDATARAHHDGWFRTGDTAVRDADGFYTIVGRTALDVIKTGGFKVGAGEVEDALRLHPDVAEVAVTGESDDDLGQRIAAWVVLHPGCSCDAAAIQTHVAGLLSSHKRPRIVRFLEALPRNAMGKVEKRKLDAAGVKPHSPALSPGRGVYIYRAVTKLRRDGSRALQQFGDRLQSAARRARSRRPFAVRVEHIRRRQRHHLELLREFAAVAAAVVDLRPRHLLTIQPGHQAAAIQHVDADADDLQAARVVITPQPLIRRHFRQTRRAPCRPEVEHDDAATQG